MKYSFAALALAVSAVSAAESQPEPTTVNGAPFFAGPDFVGSDSESQPVPTTVNGAPFFAGPDFVGSDGNYNATTEVGITVTDYTTYCPEATTVTITTCTQDKCAPHEVVATGPTTITVSGECVVPSTVAAESTTAAESTPAAVSTLTGGAAKNVAVGGVLAAVAAVAMI